MNTKDLANELVNSCSNYPGVVGVVDSDCVNEVLEKEFSGEVVPDGITDNCFRRVCLAVLHQLNKQIITPKDALPHHMYNTIYNVLRTHINVA